MQHLIFQSFKYANVYLLLLFTGLCAGVANTLYALDSMILAVLAYVFVVLPIMPLAKVLDDKGLMLQTDSGILIPSDAAMILGHSIWFISFYIGYFSYLNYKRYLARHRQLSK